MAEELQIADIQAGFLEYRSNFKEPITPLWFGRQQGEIVNSLQKALAPWQLGFENITFNQAAKSLAEAYMNFALHSLFFSLQVGIAGVTISLLHPDWSRAAVFQSLFQAGLDAVKQSTEQELQTQQVTIAFHLKQGTKPFRDAMLRFVNAKGLGSENAQFFGVSVYNDGFTLVMDKSAAFPDGVFVRLTRMFAPDAGFEAITTALYADEVSALRLLGLKLQ